MQGNGMIAGKVRGMQPKKTYNYYKGKQMNKLLSVIALMGAFICAPVAAEDITIEMLNKRDDGAKRVYSNEVATIEVGDTITWVPTSKGHNVEFIAGPDGWDAPRKSKLNKEVSITFDMPGIYVYQCSPHKSMGMIGIVAVGDGDNDVSKAKVKGKSKKKLKALLEEL